MAEDIEFKNEHVLQAAARIDSEGVRPRNQATRYEVLIRGKRYPPKEVVRFAHEAATGEYEQHLGSGGEPTNKKLRALGFPILPKKELLLAERQRNLQGDVKQSLADGPQKRRERLKRAAKAPEAVVSTVALFRRNPDVVAEVLERADGRCEECGKPAPFIKKSDGKPYLEVHHKKQLAHGGDDTVENAIAVCPNCHRKLHFGAK